MSLTENSWCQNTWFKRGCRKCYTSHGSHCFDFLVLWRNWAKAVTRFRLCELCSCSRSQSWQDWHRASWPRAQLSNDCWGATYLLLILHLTPDVKPWARSLPRHRSHAQLVGPDADEKTVSFYLSSSREVCARHQSWLDARSRVQLPVALLALPELFVSKYGLSGVPWEAWIATREWSEEEENSPRAERCSFDNQYSWQKVVRQPKHLDVPARRLRKASVNWRSQHALNLLRDARPRRCWLAGVIGDDGPRQSAGVARLRLRRAARFKWWAYFRLQTWNPSNYAFGSQLPWLQI